MLSQTTNLTPKKGAKSKRKWLPSSPSDFCGICAYSFSICLRNLDKTFISAENLSITMSMTHRFSPESRFYNIFWNSVYKKSSFFLTGFYFKVHLTPQFFFAKTNLLVIWNTSAKNFLIRIIPRFSVPWQNLENNAIFVARLSLRSMGPAAVVMSTQEDQISPVLSFPWGWCKT